uniref:Uncharacterized protein n=1 Tax=Podoviridae sp. ctaNW81 TaxID=2826562 RepID=A0A8S5M5V2_9CAUD|nr:MAG TPA: hypothetical protein [Podoviridae sp. ctaNW81]
MITVERICVAIALLAAAVVLTSILVLCIIDSKR